MYPRAPLGALLDPSWPILDPLGPINYVFKSAGMLHLLPFGCLQDATTTFMVNALPVPMLGQVYVRGLKTTTVYRICPLGGPMQSHEGHLGPILDHLGHSGQFF